MPEPSKMDLEAKLYFQSLPPALQEQLMQSAADLNTKEDLVRYCTNLLGGRFVQCVPTEGKPDLFRRERAGSENIRSNG